MNAILFGNKQPHALLDSLSSGQIALVQAIAVQQLCSAIEAEEQETKWERTRDNLNRIIQLQQQVHRGEVYATETDNSFLDGCHQGFKFRLLELAMEEPAYL